MGPTTRIPSLSRQTLSQIPGLSGVVHADSVARHVVRIIPAIKNLSIVVNYNASFITRFDVP